MNLTGRLIIITVKAVNMFDGKIGLNRKAVWPNHPQISYQKPKYCQAGRHGGREAGREAGRQAGAIYTMRKDTILGINL